MPTADSKIKKIKFTALVKDVNRAKEDVIAYLNNLGIEKVTLNTAFEPDIVNKVLSHFKKDVEDKEKHLQKLVKFVEGVKVDISEATVAIQKKEELRIKKEEQLRIQKALEESKKREAEEKKKQEFMAFLEREKKIKEQEQAEKQKRIELERIAAEKKKKAEEERKKKEEQKPADGKPEKEEPAKIIKPEEKKEIQPEVKKEHKEIQEPKKEFKKEFKKDYKKDFKKEEHKDRPFVKPTSEHSKTQKPPYNKVHGDKQHPRKFDHTKSTTSSATTGKPEYKKTTFDGKPKTEFSKDRPQYSTYGKKPYEHKKYLGKKNEKVTIADVKRRKEQEAKDQKLKPVSGEKGFVKQSVTSAKDDKWIDKKDKEKRAKIDADFERRKKKVVKIQKVKEFSQKEIDEAIRETFAKIEEDTSVSARSLARKRKKKERLEQEKIDNEIRESRKNVINVTEYLSTLELANLMSIEPTELIKKCFDLGMMVSINQRLEKDLISLMAESFGYVIEFQDEYQDDVIKDEKDSEETLKDRPPVVTIMGHVDHGKTSLLDYIRKANVVAGEAGGITQHIGAYKVRLESGKEISFLDTPGHEAFTAMRARGGQAADIVVLVVAADDSVMPQTVEAINHALAASVPIIIAINKIDKPGANSEKIKKQLADKNILIEEWGGKYQCVEISAKFGKNVESLLEKILVEAEVLELKANPDRNARGVVLESRLDRGRGILANILIQKGTLKVGDCFLAGIYWGRVKAMFDERDKKIDIAKPATPIQMLGFNGMPQAGDTFIVMDSENEVKSLALKRQQLKREQDLRQVKFTTLDDISKQIKEGKQVELNIIIKADTDGSAEALADSLHKLATNEAKVRVIHKALGQISESDVLLAEASGAIIIGFNVRPNLNARKLAEKSFVDIRIHNIIYKVIDEVKAALEGMLEPELSEEITATVEVRNVFKIPKVGNVAGCYVQDGKIIRNNKVRLVRDGFVIFDGNILSLKRIKDDVREVDTGYECGIGLENYNDVKVGDIIEAYKIVETARKLTAN